MVDEKDTPDRAEPFVRCYDILDGRLVPSDEERPGPFDRGFLYGDGLFETILVSSGRPVMLAEHIGRMASSADFLNIPALPDASVITAEIDDALRSAAETDAVLKLILSRKGDGRYDCIDHKCLFVVQVLPHTPPQREVYESGVGLLTSRARRSAESPIYRHKTLNYLENILARREAQSAGAHEALIVNTDDFIAECSMSNIFFIDGKKLLTPSLECNVLPGITRTCVLSLASSAGIPVSEQPLAFVDILQASEVFITNSLAGIVPVSEIDGKAFGKICPGPVTRAITSLYQHQILKP